MIQRRSITKSIRGTPRQVDRRIGLRDIITRPFDASNDPQLDYLFLTLLECFCYPPAPFLPELSIGWLGLCKLGN